MNKRKILLDFDLRFEDIAELNSSFAVGRCGIAYAGRNRNKSDIGTDVFEAALPSLKNVPIVGRYIPESDDFGSHDLAIVQDEESGLSIVNATSPFGVVPESASQYWQDVTDEKGVTQTYLFTDIILWKRQYGYSCIEKKKKFHQSMEINVTEHAFDQDGYLVIKKFEFEALCLLGDAVEPAFEEASVQVFSGEAVSAYKLQFSQMLDELKELSLNQEPLKIGFDYNSVTKGGTQNLKLNQEKIDEILKGYNLKLEDLNFELSDEVIATEESFKAKLDEFVAASNTGDAASQSESFAATWNQKLDAIQNALDPVVVRDENDKVVSETWYWVSDADDTYAYVNQYIYTDSDHEVNNGRFTYTFDEAAALATITSEFEKMVVRWLTMDESAKLDAARATFEQLQSDFEAYKAAYTTPDTEVAELRQFKSERLSGDHKAAMDVVLEEFADLTENAEFALLTANENEKAYAFETTDALRNACYLIVGKANRVQFAAKNGGAKPSSGSIVKVKVDGASVTLDDPYPGADAYNH